MRLRSVVVAAHPTVEPVSLGEAKAHLGILPDQTDDDGMIQAMISTSRRLIERRLGVALAEQQLRCRYDNTDGDGWFRHGQLGPAVLRLPVGPMLYDEGHPEALDVDSVAVSSSTYTVDADSSSIRFSAVPDVSDVATLTVTYWAGPAGPLAPQLRSALLLYVGHLYAHREAAGDGPVSEVPMAFETLLASESVTGSY